MSYPEHRCVGHTRREITAGVTDGRKKRPLQIIIVMLNNFLAQTKFVLVTPVLWYFLRSKHVVVD
jgi:hypothetical protein